MRPHAKISVTPEMVSRFAAYYDKNPAWGSLHVVLDDLNCDDDSVKFCRQWAREHDDKEGVELADVLLQLSYSQRKKVAKLAPSKSMYAHRVGDFKVTCDQTNNSPEDVENGLMNIDIEMKIPMYRLSFVIDKDKKVTFTR